MKYELDHVEEIQHGGNVCDMDNIVVRTPLNHMRDKRMGLAEDKAKVKSLLEEIVDCRDDSRHDKILEELDRISPDPCHIDYIFQTDDYYENDGSINMDAVVEKIFSYKPIRL